MSRAAEILKAGAGHMEDRAQTYDNPQGERSMESCVRMFNALTGHSITAEQGWHFMTCLKMVRSQQGGYRADNYEDGSAYFALAGEQAEQDRAAPAPTPEPLASEDIFGVCEDIAGLGQPAKPHPRLVERVPVSKPKGYRHKCPCGIRFFDVREDAMCICGQRTIGQWREGVRGNG